MNKFNEVNYNIERDDFRKIFYNNLGDIKVKNNKFNTDDDIFDLIYVGFETDNFKGWYYDEEVYIIHKSTLITISWYKYTHVGRCLTFSCPLTNNEVNYFFELLREDLLYECL